jgi:hypothetical protein
MVNRFAYLYITASNQYEAAASSILFKNRLADSTVLSLINLENTIKLLKLDGSRIQVL